MGEVFESTTLSTGQRVAIKVVNRTFRDPMLVERLRREAEAARRVQSEFVPQLYDVGTTPDGELFLVMELLQGETLASRLANRGGVLTWDEVFQLGEDVARGLFDAHAAGVIHRDLKPGNIFIEPDSERGERARILDFGVCKLDVHEGESLTTTGEAVGTIAYMAPEQIRGASRVDERADLYAFAMVVFEALCGRLAYDALGSIALLASKLEKPARRFSELARVPVPAGLDALLARCLSRTPAGRPASAFELLKEWRALGPATVAPPPPSSASHLSEVATETGVTAPRTLPSTARIRVGGRAGLLVAGGALLASLVVLGFALRPGLRPAVAAVEERTLGAAAPAVQPESIAMPDPASPSATSVNDLPQVVLAVSALPVAVALPEVDAGAAARPAAARPPRKRTWTPSPVPRHPKADPQIVTEPRY
jgi:serine/threonine-protein kinase